MDLRACSEMPFGLQPGAVTYTMRCSTHMHKVHLGRKTLSSKWSGKSTEAQQIFKKGMTAMLKTAKKTRNTLELFQPETYLHAVCTFTLQCVCLRVHVYTDVLAFGQPSLKRSFAEQSKGDQKTLNGLLVFRKMHQCQQAASNDEHVHNSHNPEDKPLHTNYSG